MLKAGDNFSKPYVFTLESIVDFARASGDENPLHYDEAKAAASRFGGIIASGTQMSAVLMGVIATWTTAGHDSVGLDFSFRFKKAIPAGTATTLSWTVMDVAPHRGLKGDLLTLEGRIADEAGTIYVSAQGHCVIWPQPAGSGGAPAG
jgi:acyl dehydratase